MNTSIKLIALLLIFIIIGVSSFFLGLTIGKKNTKLVYLPSPNKTTSSSINGSYTANVTGEILQVNNSTITLKKDKDQSAFALQKNVLVLAPYIKNPDPNRQPSIEPTIITDKLKFQNKVISITDLKAGQTIWMELSISQKDILVKTIHVIH